MAGGGSESCHSDGEVIECLSLGRRTANWIAFFVIAVRTASVNRLDVEVKILLL